jgi:hypothetical protein
MRIRENQVLDRAGESTHPSKTARGRAPEKSKQRLGHPPKVFNRIINGN